MKIETTLSSFFNNVLHLFFTVINKSTLRIFSGVILLVVFLTFECHAQLNLPVPDHIVFIIEENQPNFLVIGNTTAAPYINALTQDSDAATFTQMFALEHPSQPNYFDLYAGSDQGVLDDNVPANYPFTTPNMGRELMDIGRSFKTYSQNLPSVGSDVASSNGYARKHNPVTNWVGTGTNQVPDTLNQPLTSWPTDFSLLPTVSYVVPTEDSDMHNGFGNPTIAAGDYWLQEHLDSYIQWARTHNSLFIYTFDEDDGLANNNIPTVFFGPMVKGGSYTDQWTLYNILRTIEDMYGTGHAGQAAFNFPITNCWKTTATGVTNLTGSEAALKIYPNPAHDILRFEGSKENKVGDEILVEDITGRNVTILHLSDSKNVEFNTSFYTDGMYFFHIVQDNHTIQTGKFLITH